MICTNFLRRENITFVWFFSFLFGFIRFGIYSPVVFFIFILSQTAWYTALDINICMTYILFKYICGLFINFNLNKKINLRKKMHR